MTNAEMDKYIETEEFVDTLLDKIEDSGFTVDEILEELTKTIN